MKQVHPGPVSRKKPQTAIFAAGGEPILRGPEMFQTYRRMRELFPALNEKIITEAMIDRACRKLETKIHYMPLRLDGYFVPACVSRTGEAEIYVNSTLTAERQIVTAVHETVHAAIHVSSNAVMPSYPQGLTAALRRERDLLFASEFEAYAISSIALIPLPKLIRGARGLFDIGDEFLEDLWTIRLRVQELFGEHL